MAKFSMKDYNFAAKDATIDFSYVIWQFAARRAVEVAVASGHNLLMLGSPGSGKSMIAKRIPIIMPRTSMAEMIDIMNIYSISKPLHNYSDSVSG
jgi:magnesium chelatase family protein